MTYQDGQQMCCEIGARIISLKTKDDYEKVTLFTPVGGNL
jgi:hypothetical protein